jgi:hypothetical protein
VCWQVVPPCAVLECKHRLRPNSQLQQEPPPPSKGRTLFPLYSRPRTVESLLVQGLSLTRTPSPVTVSQREVQGVLDPPPSGIRQVAVAASASKQAARKAWCPGLMMAEKCLMNAVRFVGHESSLYIQGLC